MDTYHLILAWGGYAAAAALFGATLLVHPPSIDIRVIYYMCFWSGSVVIALLSAILHRQIL